jgi:hypothetical protein
MRSRIAAKRSTALRSAAAGPRLSSTSGTRPLDPLRRIGASRVSLPPHLRTPKSRARRGPPGAVLDTARAGRAPSRSSGSGLPSSASRPGAAGQPGREGKGSMSPAPCSRPSPPSRSSRSKKARLVREPDEKSRHITVQSESGRDSTLAIRLPATQCPGPGSQSCLPISRGGHERRS